MSTIGKFSRNLAQSSRAIASGPRKSKKHSVPACSSNGNSLSCPHDQQQQVIGVYLGLLVKIAAPDELIIVLESDPHLDGSPAAQRLRDRSIIASTIGTDATG